MIRCVVAVVNPTDLATSVRLIGSSWAAKRRRIEMARPIACVPVLRSGVSSSCTGRLSHVRHDVGLVSLVVQP